MIDLTKFRDARLWGGFVITEVAFREEALTDALGRDALAQTRIVGMKFDVSLRVGMPDEEVSISLYHEVLEAAAIAAPNPPESVLEFNEGDFEREALMAQKKWGQVSIENLNRMLQSFGFEGE